MRYAALALALALLVLVSCGHSNDTELSAEREELVVTSLREIIEERRFESAVAVCLPKRSDLDARLQEKLQGRPLAACPFWENPMLRSSQWELDVWRIEVFELEAIVYVRTKDPNGDPGWSYRLTYERIESSWVLRKRASGVA